MYEVNYSTVEKRFDPSRNERVHARCASLCFFCAVSLAFQLLFRSECTPKENVVLLRWCSEPQNTHFYTRNIIFNRICLLAFIGCCFSPTCYFFLVSLSCALGILLSFYTYLHELVVFWFGSWKQKILFHHVGQFVEKCIA